MGLAVVACAALVAAVVWWGVRPGLRMPAGDFANYYTAARVAASGEELTPAYTDFLWFQTRIDAGGFAGQLGSFIPHPPATALVMLPLVGFEPLRAKQIWTLANVVVAAACVAALAALAGLRWPVAALALLATGVALANDFAFGQMYLPLLLSLAGGLLLVERRRELLGGLALGVLLPIKPIAAPLVVYFALRRRWRVVGGAAAAAAVVTAVSVAALGWGLHERYLTVVLPHQMAGMLQDPFHPYWQSWQSMTRRMFVFEPTLNPNPAAVAPAFAALVAALATAAGWGATVLLLRAAPNAARLHYAAIVLATLASAPGGATYHMVIVALPVALLVGELQGSPDNRPLLVATAACAVALGLPLVAWARRFDGGWTTPLAYPRLWLLAALLAATLVMLARRADRLPSFRAVLATAIVVAAFGGVAVVRSGARPYDRAVPVEVTAAELSGPDRTVLAQPEMVGGELAFLGADPRTGVYEQFTATRRLGPAPISESRDAALSPDRRWLAFTAERDGNQDIWLRNLETGEERRLTFDPARDRDPCWEDASHVAFASDRGRGLGYTTIYRIPTGDAR